MHLRIATRGSRLALWQAHWVGSRLAEMHITSECVIIKTQGDRQQLPFQQMQGQGFFTKAVQEAVLSGKADIAVHSLKDLPSTPYPGLVLAAIPCRASAEELLIAHRDAIEPKQGWLPLQAGASIGTSALRRQTQIAGGRPDLEIRELRGNVPSRIQKLRERRVDAILLAAAGVQRLDLDLSDLFAKTLSPLEFVPAPAQGALAIECSSKNSALLQRLQALQDPSAARTCHLERALMAKWDSGCQLAMGAWARFLPTPNENPTTSPNQEKTSPSREEKAEKVELIAWYGRQKLHLPSWEAHRVVEEAFSRLSSDNPKP